MGKKRLAARERPPVGLSAALYFFDTLEAELRTNRDSQIVVSSAVEVDIITGFKAKTDRSGKSFDAGGRVKREVRSAVGQANRVDETGGRILVIDAEVVEPDFTGNEEPEGARARLEFRAKEAMQSSETLYSPSSC